MTALQLSLHGLLGLQMTGDLSFQVPLQLVGTLLFSQGVGAPNENGVGVGVSPSLSPFNNRLGQHLGDTPPGPPSGRGGSRQSSGRLGPQ